MLQRRSLELQHRDTRLRIQGVMKPEPDVLPKLKDFLLSIGRWDAQATGKPEPKALEDGAAGPDKSHDDPHPATTPNKHGERRPRHVELQRAQGSVPGQSHRAL